jgi:hypothetical protein
VDYEPWLDSTCLVIGVNQNLAGHYVALCILIQATSSLEA